MQVIDQSQEKTDQFLRDFVQAVMKKASLTERDGSFDEAYVQSLMEELQKYLGIMIMDALPAEQFEAYTKMIYEEHADAKTVGAFLEKQISDFPKKRQKVMEDFAARILQTAKETQAALS